MRSAARPLRSPYRRLIPALTLAALTAWGAAALYLAAAVQRDLRALETLAGQPLEQLDWSAARTAVRAARRDTAALQGVTAPGLWLTSALGWVPGLGPDLAQAADLLELAAQLSRAADEGLAAALPLLDEMERAASASDGLAGIVAQWPQAQPHLDAAALALERAAVARARMERVTLSPTQQRRIDRVDALLPRARLAIDLARTLPGWLGVAAPETYLLLAQNQDELRAAGGFISGAGVLTLDRGRVVELEIRDAYDLDDFSRGPYPAPPEPLSRYMGSQLWVLRDANWSPDFPTSAQTAAALYALGQDRRMDGVVAFDQTAIQQLLAAIGPVTVDTNLVNSENVVTYMRAAWSAEPSAGVSREWFARRKDFMGALGRALLEKLMTRRQRAEFIRVARALQSGLQERHVLVWSTHSTQTALLAEAGWDGHVQTGAGDYWMWVDSNVGFNKVNPAIEQSLEYVIDLSDPVRPNATFHVHYHNTVSRVVPCRHAADYGSGQYADLMERCYWDYWRLLVPVGSELVNGPANAVPAEQLLTKIPDFAPVHSQPGDGGTVEFSGIFVLPPRSDQELLLSYALPASILNPSTDGALRYRLRIQKQPGTGALPVKLVVLYPPEWIISRPLFAANLSTGLVQADLTLQTDLELEVAFRTR